MRHSPLHRFNKIIWATKEREVEINTTTRIWLFTLARALVRSFHVSPARGFAVLTHCVQNCLLYGACLCAVVCIALKVWLHSNALINISPQLTGFLFHPPSIFSTLHFLDRPFILPFSDGLYARSPYHNTEMQVVWRHAQTEILRGSCSSQKQL